MGKVFLGCERMKSLMCICLAFQYPSFDEWGIFEGETQEEGAAGSMKEFFLPSFRYCKAKMYKHLIRVVGINCWILQKTKKDYFVLSPYTLCPEVTQAVTSCNDWWLVFLLCVRLCPKCWQLRCHLYIIEDPVEA